MEGKRIFIAVDISERAREVCSRHVSQLRSRFSQGSIRWERPEKLHLTLKFLGQVEQSLLSDVSQSMKEVAGEVHSFGLSLSGAGVFPSERGPRVLWIGVSGTEDGIGLLYRRVEDACDALGFKREKRRFHPHLTIGRVREPSGAFEAIRAHLTARIEPVEFEVSDLVVYESKLQPTGSVYSAITRSKLGS